MSLSEETIIGLRAVKAAVGKCVGVNKVTKTLDFLKVAKN